MVSASEQASMTEVSLDGWERRKAFVGFTEEGPNPIARRVDSHVLEPVDSSQLAEGVLTSWLYGRPLGQPHGPSIAFKERDPWLYT